MTPLLIDPRILPCFMAFGGCLNSYHDTKLHILARVSWKAYHDVNLGRVDAKGKCWLICCDFSQGGHLCRAVLLAKHRCCQLLLHFDFTRLTLNSLVDMCAGATLVALMISMLSHHFVPVRNMACSGVTGFHFTSIFFFFLRE